MQCPVGVAWARARARPSAEHVRRLRHARGRLRPVGAGQVFELQRMAHAALTRSTESRVLRPPGDAKYVKLE